MAQAYSVSINISGITQLAQGLRQAADVAKTLKMTRTAVGGNASTITPTLNAANIAKAHQQRANQALRLQAQSLRAQASLLKAQAQYSKAAAGDPTQIIKGPSQAQMLRQNAAIMNAQASHMRAQQNLSRAGGGGRQQGFVSRLGTFARSTRFGQAGFMPLLGRGLDVLGAKDPRIAIAVMGIALAARALGQVAASAKEAADALQELSAQKIVSGGTSGETSFLRALGITDIAGASSSLRQLLTRDPLAQSAAYRMGIGTQGFVPQAFGSQNNAEILVKALEGLRNITDATEQLRQAHMLQLEGMLPLIRGSKELWENYKVDAKLQGEILDQNAGTAREFNGALSRLQMNFNSLKEALAGPVMQVLTPAITGLANAFGGLAVMVKNGIPGIINFFKTIIKFGEIVSGGRIPVGSADTFDAYIKAAQANANATNNNTQQLQQLNYAFKNGQFGGGARAGSAIPSSLRGYVLQRAIEGGTLRLGAFGV